MRPASAAQAAVAVAGSPASTIAAPRAGHASATIDRNTSTKPASSADRNGHGSNGHGNGHGGNGHGGNGHGNGANGRVDPRAVLPLDRDERGFGGF